MIHNPSAIGASGYRPDIDGLRAIAVLPVVLFHLGAAVFPGGFVGVDVFFVISGYLITSAIHRELSTGQFSILNFYERRARRILPALFATIVATIIAGCILSMPDELRDTGASVVSTALFASNILFWLQIDYFNSAADLKPLLHTWSLAVEEQFYIFFPLILFLVAKFAIRRVTSLILVLAIFSFTFSVFTLSTQPEANYYLLPFRAWELLCGSLLALGGVPAIRSQLVAEVSSCSGLVAILASASLLNDHSLFPGWNALWPCLGAVLIIHANANHATWTSRFLSLKFLVNIGIISYSIYLIHWPLLVYIKYTALRPLYTGEVFGVFVATIVLAWIMWRYVEQPFRNRRRINRSVILTWGGIGIVCLASAGILLFTSAGLPQRFPSVKPAEVVNVADVPFADGTKCFLNAIEDKWAGDKCYITKKGQPVVLLWGDSHANHYRTSIAELAENTDKSFLFYASSGCLPILGREVPGRPWCLANNANVLSIIENYKVEEVILSGYWQYAIDLNDFTMNDVAETVQRIRATGVRVKIIGAGPDFPFANPEYLARRLRERSDADAPYYTGIRNERSFNDRLRQISNPDAFFDPMAALCVNDECLAYEGGQSIMSDNAHLSKYGADLVVNAMLPFLLN